MEELSGSKLWTLNINNGINKVQITDPNKLQGDDFKPVQDEKIKSRNVNVAPIL